MGNKNQLSEEQLKQASNVINKANEKQRVRVGNLTYKLDVQLAYNEALEEEKNRLKTENEKLMEENKQLRKTLEELEKPKNKTT